MWNLPTTQTPSAKISKRCGRPWSSDVVPIVTETLDHDRGRGRQVSVYIPSVPPVAVVYAGDGQLIAPWGEVIEAAGAPPTMIVGVHRLDDEMLRLHEYSPGFDPQ